jgi:microcystin-dependent protein
MADKFRTQDVPLTGHVSYILDLPEALWFLAEMSDLLHDMTLTENWEQVGAVTVDEAVQVARSMYLGMRTMIGAILPYVTNALPANSLPCDGSEYHRLDYPLLYAVLDPVFVVDADHFITPDLRGRTVIASGSGTGLTPRAVGATGGEETHTLSSGEMPVHSHTPSGHIHSIHSHITLVALAPGELPVSCPNPLPESTSNGWDSIGNAGGDGAHNNMQPFIALKYCVVAS